MNDNRCTFGRCASDAEFCVEILLDANNRNELKKRVNILEKYCLKMFYISGVQETEFPFNFHSRLINRLPNFFDSDSQYRIQWLNFLNFSTDCDSSALASSSPLNFDSVLNDYDPDSNSDSPPN